MKQDFIYTGFLNIYKEAGFSSHDVVAKLRGILHQKKIGHTGTLDPDAEGVLPVALGRATKAISLLEDHSKGYDVRLLLGVKTDTYDTSGRVAASVFPLSDGIGEDDRSPDDSDGNGAVCTEWYEKWRTEKIRNTAEIERTLGISEKQVREAILSFQGDLMQVPPMYSAKKVNGKRLYELAREGIVIERKAVPVRIDGISDLKISLPEASFHVECSKGTYIRSLCHDIGEKLGCGGCMSKLVRTRAGQFSIEDAHRLDEIQSMMDGLNDQRNREETDGKTSGQIESTIEGWILPIDHAFSDFPMLLVKDESTKRAQNGNPISLSDLENPEAAKASQFRIYVCQNKFLGIYEWRGKNLYPRKVFAE
ncbi:MAG: tRNA pseudouridine(55) synthase TruB [Lachnospiraceae bacterium]|nr:tRNA pseudouridine(55) synthase TruB [Lachnospiraceae bacterium]